MGAHGRSGGHWVKRVHGKDSECTCRYRKGSLHVPWPNVCAPPPLIAYASIHWNSWTDIYIYMMQQHEMSRNVHYMHFALFIVSG